MASVIFRRALSIFDVINYKSGLNNCFQNMCVANDYNSLTIDLIDGYNILKDASYTICDGKINTYYDHLLNRMIDCEDLVDSTFIVSSNPSFDVLDKRFMGKSVFQIDKKNILDYMIWFTRMRLLDSYVDSNDGVMVDFNLLDLTNECKFACNIIKMFCETSNIKCEVIKIPPAFTDEYKLYGGNGFHYFCLVTIDGISYIVDPTYRQFFTLDNNLIERMGVMGMDGCAPGIYMLMNGSRRKTAMSILNKGYIVADEINLKNYLDGFMLSYRNGLYYERVLKESIYTTPYSVSDYFKFLKGDKLLFDCEPIEFLGEQEEPLNNRNFRF